MQLRILIFVLLASVLVCPYLCLGEAVGAEVAPCQSGQRLLSLFGQAGCCGCSSDQEQPGQDLPSPPLQHDPDCFCHGVISAGVLRSLDFDLSTSPAIYGFIDDAVLPSTGHSLASISFEPPHSFPPFSTGRDVCMLICTRLL